MRLLGEFSKHDYCRRALTTFISVGISRVLFFFSIASLLAGISLSLAYRGPPLGSQSSTGTLVRCDHRGRLYKALGGTHAHSRLQGGTEVHHQSCNESR